MNEKNMKVVLDKGVAMPKRAYALDAGFDIRTPERIVLRPHDCVTVDTGIHIQIPAGYVGMLKSKSGLNIKHDIIGEGVIDAGYTGSIQVKLYNMGGSIHIFEKGDKIIQLVILPIYTGDLEQVESLEETERGSNGLGSTGV